MTDTLELPDIIRAFLETQSTMALATLNASGRPEVAPVFYIADERLNLYWLSPANSRHSANLRHSSRVAASIYHAVWAWQDFAALQIEGAATLITDDRLREQMLVAYLRKFTVPAALDATITSGLLYQLRPDWIRWLDNTVAIGYRAELRL